MKKLLYLAIAVLLASIVYFVVIPSINKNKDDEVLKDVRTIVAFTKNYYGYNNPNALEIDEDEAYSKIGFKGNKPDYSKLYIDNGNVAAAIVYNNVCYHKDYTGEIEYDNMNTGEICSIYGIITNDKCFTLNGTIITGYDKSCGSYVNIPSEINNVKITEIGDNAFSDKKLTKVIIPDTITKVGNNAFSNNKISYLVVNSDTIGNNAFSNNSLTEFYVTSKNIGNYAFSENKLESVSFSSNVNSLGDYAFYKNKLGHVNIAGSIVNVGASCFENNALESIVIGKTVKSIGENCFRNNKLVNIVIPKNVTSVGDGAFYKDAISNSELTVFYNATGLNLDYSKVIGPSYKTVDISKL